MKRTSVLLLSVMSLLCTDDIVSNRSNTYQAVISYETYKFHDTTCEIGSENPHVSSYTADCFRYGIDSSMDVIDSIQVPNSFYEITVDKMNGKATLLNREYFYHENDSQVILAFDRYTNPCTCSQTAEKIVIADTLVFRNADDYYELTMSIWFEGGAVTKTIHGPDFNTNDFISYLDSMHEMRYLKCDSIDKGLVVNTCSTAFCLQPRPCTYNYKDTSSFYYFILKYYK